MYRWATSRRTLVLCVSIGLVVLACLGGCGIVCLDCEGTGECAVCDGDGVFIGMSCTNCGGSGNCPECGGSG